jgi:hypothetical protein
MRSDAANFNSRGLQASALCSSAVVTRTWFCWVACSPCAATHATHSRHVLSNVTLRTDDSASFTACITPHNVDIDSHTAAPPPQPPLTPLHQPHLPLLHPPAEFSDLDLIFGRHLPLADPPRVAVLLTGSLRNFLSLKRQEPSS